MSASTGDEGDVACVLAYHERTKHHPDRFARSPGYLDWANQPDPFRTYDGAPGIDLPLTADAIDTCYSELHAPPSGATVGPRSLDVESIGAFFELALGLTAWKEIGASRWALRADPSSGNLHPTEGYLVAPELPGVPAGVHHYLSRDHRLEQRCALDAERANELRHLLPADSFLVGIASIHWREAWKYGERAFRYCQHDAGHVIGTVRYAAAALGWSARLADACGDAAVAAVLGLDREEDVGAIDRRDREHPDALLLVTRDGGAAKAGELEAVGAEMAALLAAGSWAGRPNVLSPDHVEWKVIEEVAQATHKPPSQDRACVPRPAPATAFEPLGPPARCELPAATIIRRRRSAVALDGVTSIARDRFYAVLERLVPRPETAPFDALPWKARIHLGIFVHRVEGLAPGLYLFERSDDVHAAFAAELGDGALWTRPEGCPEHLRLFCLAERDLREVAAFLSCRQDIAADGAFSLGMLADYREVIAEGAYHYRRLFWETGVIGQALYLEAEALGIRGTGIGCYFDDVFHEVVGLEGDRFQSLYHFTVGGPVEDTRLVTHPPYAHLAERSPTH